MDLMNLGLYERQMFYMTFTHFLSSSLHKRTHYFLHWHWTPATDVNRDVQNCLISTKFQLVCPSTPPPLPVLMQHVLLLHLLLIYLHLSSITPVHPPPLSVNSSASLLLLVCPINAFIWFVLTHTNKHTLRHVASATVRVLLVCQLGHCHWLLHTFSPPLMLSHIRDSLCLHVLSVFPVSATVPLTV